MKQDTSIIKITAECIINENGVYVGDGETFKVPIGALTVFEAVFTVNGKKANVNFSNWDIEGWQVIVNNNKGSVEVQQDDRIGRGILKKPLIISGGWLGNKAKIGTAWVDAAGMYKIVVTGNATLDLILYEFKITSHVELLCPKFKFLQGDVSQPTMDDNNCLTTICAVFAEYDAGTEIMGDTVGFLQLINGLRVRQGKNELDQFFQQYKGRAQDEAFIDIGEIGNLFYSDQKITKVKDSLYFQDTPSQYCDEKEKYQQYFIGKVSYKPTDDESHFEKFELYFAYKAAIKGTTLQSFIVVQKCCNWSWRMLGVYKDEGYGKEWGPNPDFTRESFTVQTSKWMLPQWEYNSIKLNNWRTMM